MDIRDNIKCVKIFVASSSELVEERRNCILSFNSINKLFRHLKIEPVEWETDLPSGSYDVSRIQDEINPHLLDSDIVIAMFYSRVGSFTHEEYRLTVDEGKKIFIYFKKGFSPQNLEESKNYEEVLKFKNQLEEENQTLYVEYGDLNELENCIRKDLGLLITAKFPRSPTHPGKTVMVTNLSRLSDNFTGRENELERIKALLEEREVLVIAGNGGIGKTQLVLQYIKKNRDSYKHIAFIDATSLDAISSTYARILGITNDENTISIMKKWANENNEWLFVYDNFDEGSAHSFYRDYMIDPTNGKIIITSRLSNWDREVLQLDVFTEDESMAFLESKTKSNNKEGARLLSNELGHYPLALEQAGAYINHCRITYNDYIELFQVEQHKWEMMDAEKDNKYTTTVAKTLIISNEKIADTASKELLYLLSFFESDYIPIKIFEDGRKFLPESIKVALNDRINYANVYTNLSDYSLISFSGKYILVHKLVQDVARYTMKDQIGWCSYCVKLMKVYYTDDVYNSKDTWEYTCSLMPHVISIVKHSARNGIKHGLEPLFEMICRLYFKTGNWTKAEDNLLKYLEIIKTSEDKRSICIVNYQLAMVYQYKSDFVREIEYCNKVLKHIDASEPEILIETIILLGDCCRMKGEYANALEQFRRAEELYIHYPNKKFLLQQARISLSKGFIFNHMENDKAEEELTRSYGLFGEVDDKQGQGAALIYWGLHRLKKRDLNLAKENFDEALIISRGGKNRMLEYFALTVQAQIHLLQGKIVKAYDLCIDSLNNKLEFGARYGIADSLMILSYIIQSLPDDLDERRLFNKSQLIQILNNIGTYHSNLLDDTESKQLQELTVVDDSVDLPILLLNCAIGMFKHLDAKYSTDKAFIEKANIYILRGDITLARKILSKMADKYSSSSSQYYYKELDTQIALLLSSLTVS